MHPVLHRPTFERQVAAGLHNQNINFARIYLLVCALGSRFSSDPRVTLPTADGKTHWASAGWSYFSQVMSINSMLLDRHLKGQSHTKTCMILEPILASAGLSDLQVVALTALYLTGCSAPHTAWIMVGIGLRCAQDIGAHREQVRDSRSLT